MRPVTSFHQIELTSRCNLQCVYCPSREIMKGKSGKYPDRGAGDMDVATFDRALEHVRHFVKKGTQRELNLAGIGESTLHPAFREYLRMARAAVGPSLFINFTTNGLLFNEELAKTMAALNIKCFVSNHRPEKSGPAIQLARKYGVLLGTSNDPAENPINWAGQVDWAVGCAPNRICPWVTLGRAFVMSDGRVTRCCYDASGKGVIGDVWSEGIGAFDTSPWELCKSCEQTIPKEYQ